MSDSRRSPSEGRDGDSLDSLKAMFPAVESSTISSVLRANEGDVAAAIVQLRVMTSEGQPPPQGATTMPNARPR